MHSPLHPLTQVKPRRQSTNYPGFQPRAGQPSKCL